ncbi:O-antigen ligase family protein [Heliophilum fasciatum]|uniref:Tetratricopeptide repeat protein n=1 Tax=Heliophilum fasciatum TaxID=35700 RepID=A0A4R2RY55_9FIRM|nr:O-antigen ligase family protein [Heliophilum fasciatum]MCW2279004.1 tetratricopeptide (TPR) repeat protein [Heliophilum fasciatum]TCP64045.1 tetratricopeptide repeat protein [Heliophilum fasciatum]
MEKAGNGNRIVLLLLSVFLLGLVLVAPFFRGLFYESEMGIHHYAVAVLTIAFGTMYWTRKDWPSQPHNIIQSPYFISIGILAVLYGEAVFFAVNPREALFTWLRQLDVLSVFVMMYIVTWAWRERIVRWITKTYVEIVMIGMVITGVTMAVVGILLAQGFLTLPGGMLADRISSTLQYPNTLGAYLTVTLWLAIHLAAHERRLTWAATYTSAAFILMSTILGSQSRGLLVVLPVLLVLFLLGQRERLQAASIFGLVFLMAAGLYAQTVGAQAQATPSNMRALFITIGGIIASGAIWGGIRYLARQRHRLRGISKNWIIAATLGVVMLGVGGWWGWNNGTAENAVTAPASITTTTPASITTTTPASITASNSADMATTTPADIASPTSSEALAEETVASSTTGGAFARLASMSAGDQNIRERFVFYRDAATMAMERPLLGWGGGGWKSAYRAYQSYLYNTTETHNHFAQVWVETGTLGLLAFVFPFVAIGVGFVGLWKKRVLLPEAAQAWTIGVAALGLGIHSFMDFNLSLTSVLLLLWTLLALLGALENRLGVGVGALWSGATKKLDPLAPPPMLRPVLISLMVLAIPLAGFTFTLRYGDAKLAEYNEAMQQGDGERAMAALEAAAKVDTWRAEFSAKQIKMYIGSIANNPDPRAQQYIVAEMLKLANKAIDLDSYNGEHYFQLAQVYTITGQYDQAFAAAEKALKLRPWVVTTYEQLAESYINVELKKRLQAGASESEQPVHTVEKMSRVLEIVHEVEGKKATLPENLKTLWRHSPDMVVTPRLALTAGQAALFQGDLAQAKRYMETALNGADSQLQPLVKAWLGMVLVKQGNATGNQLLQEAKQGGSIVEQELQRIEKLKL